jgi:hypothetical protein
MHHVTSVICAAISGCLLMAASPAQAQNAPAAPVETRIIEIYTDADAKAVLDARLAALKTVLDLTPEQEKLWAPVEASIRKIAADSAARGKQRSETEPPADFLVALDRIGGAEVARGQDMRNFAAAARPLVAALTDAQKHRMPAFLGMLADAQSPLATRSLWLFEEEER